MRRASCPTGRPRGKGRPLGRPAWVASSWGRPHPAAWHPYHWNPPLNMSSRAQDTALTTTLLGHQKHEQTEPRTLRYDRQRLIKGRKSCSFPDAHRGCAERRAGALAAGYPDSTQNLLWHRINTSASHLLPRLSKHCAVTSWAQCPCLARSSSAPEWCS